MSRQRLRDTDPHKFYGRVYVSTALTAVSVFLAVTAGTGAEALGKHGLALFWRLSPFFAPLMGILLHDLAYATAGRLSGGLFWGKGGRPAPAHSEGESLVKLAKYEEAAEWFASRAMEDPDDWRAQERVVQIWAKHLGDPERAAEERGRLLRHAVVPEPIWVEAALEQGRYWEGAGRPDRAESVYKGLMWKYPDGADAEEARRRITALSLGGSVGVPPGPVAEEGGGQETAADDQE